ncbi:DUF4396 domain-containing protein [Roseicella frigidaeris]|uniref:DUF4396 domain-containing protein n=1 Tax=Roseicella frigidaeris TaxID=2230885 RepID=UPI001FB25219|nr:DUF4396 domain-containing protein [Roseicella frigidaeris]
MIPTWLHGLAIVALLLGALCAAVILVDVIRHPQHMGIMNVVWPVTALFGTVIALWGYFAYGRLATHEKAHAAMQRHKEMPSKKETPFPVMVAKGASHCGSGCTLGDIIAEWLVFFVPTIAIWFGWRSLFDEKCSPSGSSTTFSPSSSASPSSISPSSRCGTCRSARAWCRRSRPTPCR